MELFSAIADLRGPELLALYFVVSAATITACGLWARRPGPAPRTPPPQPPGAGTDPYEIAWLRGGANAVLTTALLSLRQRGTITLGEPSTEQTLGSGSHDAERVPKKLDHGEADALVHVPGRPKPDRFVEWAVYSAIDGATPLGTILKDRSIWDTVERVCEPYHRKFLHLGLITSPTEQQRAWTAMATGLAVILGLGALGLVATILTGHYNVGSLILLGLLASTLVVWLCAPPRLSARGRRYLASLRNTYDVSWKQSGNAATTAGLGDSLPLYVAMFGTDVLAGTEFDAMHRVVRKGRDGWADDGWAANRGRSSAESEI
jgi:uncharacterized protein (TIGR04222 family)